VDVNHIDNAVCELLRDSCLHGCLPVKGHEEKLQICLSNDNGSDNNNDKRNPLQGVFGCSA
jgi:hypothetical protein